MRLFNTKTITTFAKTILVLMAVFVIVLGPVGANYVHAQQPAPPQGGGFTHPMVQAGERILETTIPSTSQIAQKVAELVGWFNSWLIPAVQWAANLFAGTVDIADAPLREVQAITVGWTIVRDIANIFLIFILLVIAIATILRIESYGARALLVRLILVALLINFSLLAAQVVVDASNILGRTFLAKLHPIDVKLASVLQLSKLTASGTNTPSSPRGIALPPNNVMAAIPNRGAFDADTTNIVDQALSNAGQNQFNPSTALMFINVVILVFLLLAFFVFIALSIFYITRTIALLVLFVLAPFGFLFLTLPATRGLATKWWTKLFEWSFFYPISMFFLYLSVVWGVQITSLQLQGSLVLNAGLVFHYITMIGFLLASVLVAKQMGIYGAGAVIGMGIAGRKMLTGYVGRGAKYAAKGATLGATYPVRAPAKALGRSIGDYAGKLLEQGKAPIGTRGILSRIASKREEVAEKEAEKYKRLSPEQKARFAGRDPFSMSAAGQAKMFDKMNDKEKQRFMKALGTENHETFAKRMSKFDLTKDVAKASGNLHRAMQMIYASSYEGKSPPVNDPEYRQRALDFLGDLNDQQMKIIDADTIKSEYFADYFANNARNFNDVTNTRDQIKAAKELVDILIARNSVNTAQPPADIAKDLADAIENKGNRQLAQQIRGNIGINLIFDPNLVGVRSRRGNVNIQTGAPTP